MAFPGRVNKTDQGGLKLGLLLIIILVLCLVVWMVWDIANIIKSPSVPAKAEESNPQRKNVNTRSGTVAHKVNNDLRQLMHGDVLGHDTPVPKEVINDPFQYKSSSDSSPGSKGYYEKQ